MVVDTFFVKKKVWELQLYNFKPQLPLTTTIYFSSTGWSAALTLTLRVLMAAASEESSLGIATGIVTLLLNNSKVSRTLKVTENDLLLEGRQSRTL